MDSLLSILNNPMVIMAVQLGVGWLVKNKTKIVNGSIPLINYVVGVLIQLPGVAFQPAPAIVDVGFWDTAGSIFRNPLFTSLIYTLLSTGTHSASKNVLSLVRPATS